MKQKVFCIGFHKTGTTTPRYGFESAGLLGSPALTVSKIQDRRENVYDMAFKLVEQYDAFKDNPWPMLFRELDARIRGSKFVLTVRPGTPLVTKPIEHLALSKHRCESGYTGPVARWGTKTSTCTGSNVTTVRSSPLRGAPNRPAGA